MSIVRVVKPERYSIIANTCFNDDRLSYRAVGLLCYLLSKPNHWQVRTSELAKSHTEGRDAVLATIAELGRYGYITREKGFGEVNYTVHEEPLPVAENQEPGNQGPDDQATGKPTLVKTESKQALSKAKTDHTPLPPASKAGSTGRLTALRVEDLNKVASIYPTHRVPLTKRPEIAEAWNALVAANKAPVLALLVADIDRRKKSYDWTRDGGRYVPNLLKYLAERMWNHPILPAPVGNRADMNRGGRGELVL